MNENRPKNEKHTPSGPAHESASTTELMDEQVVNEEILVREHHVKVLSPGMMVLKRFIRNRLAITGLIILVVMFIFSFIGGLLSPYSQQETFYSTESMFKDYASATKNTELRYTVKEDEAFSKGAYARFLLSLGKQKTVFESDGKTYSYREIGDDFYIVEEDKILSEVATRKNLFAYKDAKGYTTSQGMREAFEKAYIAKEDNFVFENEEYQIIRDKIAAFIAQPIDVAVASYLIFDPVNQEDSKYINSYDFRVDSQKAIDLRLTEFTSNGQSFDIEYLDGSILMNRINSGMKEPFAVASDMIVNAISPDIFLNVEFKEAVLDAITDSESSVVIPNAAGEDVYYRIELVNSIYTIKSEVITRVIDMYHQPDSKHWLGTDQNGMDLLTRLMYGGRVSLLVGFIVVLLEMIIGIIVGGISGYFGKWVDTLLMRFIDLFNSIPYFPIMIIAGAVMDTMEVDPYLRVFYLMIILGLLGWTGIARVVRGQILALREQDFMVATEATGIRVSRRISKHLIPNVMPLLIVQATMSLGSIILTEATLSFLGLGIKYPIASWGSIINAASIPYVVTNYWFVWIPAGLLILLTVLGFNFVGDGLRDAYDPKMKR
ncbi:MAG: ABC transporter permease [Clostridiales bacterium]|nr:ABC transporter permease [Clostridiales bacterium]